MNTNNPATQLTKLEYALIHSTWEPDREDVKSEEQMDRLNNPYNDNHKPKLRNHAEIVRDLKKKYFTTLLN